MHWQNQALYVPDLLVGCNGRTSLRFFERKVESQEFWAPLSGLAIMIFMSIQIPGAMATFALGILLTVTSVHLVLMHGVINKLLLALEFLSVNLRTNLSFRFNHHPLQSEATRIQPVEGVAL